MRGFIFTEKCENATEYRWAEAGLFVSLEQKITPVMEIDIGFLPAWSLRVRTIDAKIGTAGIKRGREKRGRVGTGGRALTDGLDPGLRQSSPSLPAGLSTPVLIQCP